MMNTPGGKITLSMLESRICSKLGLDESKVKLQMKYNVVIDMSIICMFYTSFYHHFESSFIHLS